MRKFTIAVALIIAVAFVGSAFASSPGKTVEYAGGDAGKVVFDGKTHNTRLGPGKCMECHKGNVPFAMKKGSFKMPKEDHVPGKLCGTCHDGTKAFGQEKPEDCAKCHQKSAPCPPVPPVPKQ
ncbi:MAG: c(7)-type cytochrome triheme domain-containing protein [Thermodesulfovibrionales bacterium]